MHFNTKHGHTVNKKKIGVSGTYGSWKAMKERCFNPKVKEFKNYGGRGISICQRWLSFDNFLADMGERPNDMTLDRIDSNGNYSKENCKWSTKSQQMLNKRCTNKIGLLGVSRSSNGKKFVAHIEANNKTYHIGTFDTPKLASLAYEACRSVLLSPHH